MLYSYVTKKWIDIFMVYIGIIVIILLICMFGNKGMSSSKYDEVLAEAADMNATYGYYSTGDYLKVIGGKDKEEVIVQEAPKHINSVLKLTDVSGITFEGTPMELLIKLGLKESTIPNAYTADLDMATKFVKSMERNGWGIEEHIYTPRYMDIYMHKGSKITRVLVTKKYVRVFDNCEEIPFDAKDFVYDFAGIDSSQKTK